ncbi:creatininase family protein [Streptacidiphilus fuscans]|uniref:Creatininase family protein n=1 Tax=Streptacidiphilus fuscans TaxID=2789292 RepID=A0A931AYB7_9ACTN|nr:creatininase family protein [Streptacidiphilus fuscans]MBF9066971.1 creatininase family protein [Streptacidiphilus fuscans]
MTLHHPIARLGDLTRDEVADAAAHSVLVLPIGAVEQHGPHLPLRTDTLLAETVATAAVEACSGTVPAVLAPVMPYGNSEHHLFAGAASLRPATLAAVLGDLVRSLHTTGFQRFFLVNGHGGNDETVRLVSKSIVTELPVAVGTVNYWQAGSSAEPVPDGADVPGHAGWWETSLVLAVRPELVRTENAPSEPLGARGLYSYEPVPGLNVQMRGEWARSGGTTDPAAAADPGAGRRMLNERTAGVAEALTRFHELTREQQTR